MIYNVLDKLRYTNEVLINTLKAQIDNSLLYGWAKEDIILGTNFDFEYNGIKNVTLKNICTFNPFVNKWYGALELLETGVLTDDFWMHDQDNWQVEKFEFPSFEQNLAGCTYKYLGEINTGSLFFKKTSMDFLKYIVKFIDANKHLKVASDENYIALMRSNTNAVRHINIINNEYNVGMTNFQHRFDSAVKPIKVIGVKPHDKDCLKFYTDKDLVPMELINIFKNNKLN
jgi:hypothetical protein